MAKKAKFYVVWKGKKPGIYKSWEECVAQINGFPGAKIKAFDSLDASTRAFTGQDPEYIKMLADEIDHKYLGELDPPILRSWSVDAAYSHTSGKMEYRGVKTATKEIIFAQGPFEAATMNIGEFLAIVHALAECKRRNISHPIYSDSTNAIHWVRIRRCKTNLQRTAINDNLFILIERAEKWLYNNTYDNSVLKWETDEWGENPADYGRK